MKIKEVTSQYRYDFTAIIECEHCQHEQKLETGYDDSYYHTRVMPEMKCKNCGKSRNDEGEK